MKRKILLILLSSVTVLGCSLALSACASGHTHSYADTVVDPTCTKQGYTLHTCSCGDSYRDNLVDPLGHTEVIDEGKKATCTETGLSDGKHCSVCHTVITEQTELLALGHDYKYGVCTHCGALNVTEGLAYKLNSDGKSYYVSGIGATTDNEIVIPDKYKDLPVTSIGENAFSMIRDSLKSIVIPDSITSINNYTFSSFSVLENVNIGNGITSIGTEAFNNCTNLRNVILGNKVTSIGNSAFRFCNNLTNITFPDSVKTIGDEAFYGCVNITNLTIGNSVSKIGDRSFSHCSGITDIIVSNSLTEIGDWAFCGCNITSIIIPNYNAKLGVGVFSICSRLESITLPSASFTEEISYTTYRYPFGYIFGGSNYTGGTATEQYNVNTQNNYHEAVTYYIPASLKEVNVTSNHILSETFENCSGIKSVICSGGVTIEATAFENCSGLESITLGKRIATIENAFNGCSNLKSIYYSGDIAGWCKISGLPCLMTKECTLYINGQKLTGELIIPDEVTSIGDYAFYGCSGLSSVVIPNSIASVGSAAFDGCNIKFNVFDNAKYLGNSEKPYLVLVEANSKDISNCTIHEDTQSIMPSAFRKCSSLTSIIIPDNVKTIGNSAFYYCDALENITIGAGVNLIGSYSFYSCYKLTSVTFKNTSGWRTATSPTSYGTSIEVANISASKLTYEYSYYYWKRS